MLTGLATAALYVSLAMLGDSIVARMAPHQAGMSSPFSSAANLGVDGLTVAQIAARIRSVPSRATHVMIEGGTNDLLWLRTDIGIVPGYKSMLDAIPSSKQVIVAGIPQVDEAVINPGFLPYLNNKQIARINARLVTLCASYSNCVAATDLMALEMRGKTTDGIHLNAAGYAAFVAAIASALSYGEDTRRGDVGGLQRVSFGILQ
jgi:lysophospholipase L1-like esterase